MHGSILALWAGRIQVTSCVRKHVSFKAFESLCIRRLIHSSVAYKARLVVGMKLGLAWCCWLSLPSAGEDPVLCQHRLTALVARLYCRLPAGGGGLTPLVTTFCLPDTLYCCSASRSSDPTYQPLGCLGCHFCLWDSALCCLRASPSLQLRDACCSGHE